MTHPCPNCGFIDDPYEREFERLRRRGRDLGIHTSGSISEDNAARILSVAKETLRSWRKGLAPDEAPLRYYRNGRGAISYRIEDLVRFNIGQK